MFECATHTQMGNEDVSLARHRRCEYWCIVFGECEEYIHLKSPCWKNNAEHYF